MILPSLRMGLYLVWKNKETKSLFLPQNILKKFIKNPLKAVARIKELVGEDDILNYEVIVTLSEDKYTKQAYSLLIVQNIHMILESNEQTDVIIYKPRDNFSDRLLKVPDVFQDQLRIDSTVGQIEVFLQFIQHKGTQNIRDKLYQINFNQNTYNKLMDEIRDLLYFLYDFKFFETYDILNESSVFMSKRLTIASSVSSSTESEYIQDDDLNSRDISPNESQIEDIIKDKIILEQQSEYDKRTKQKCSQQYNQEGNDHQRKLSIIVEETNESLGLSFDHRIYPDEQSYIEEKAEDNYATSFDIIQLQNCERKQKQKAIENSIVKQSPVPIIPNISINFPIKSRQLSNQPKSQTQISQVCQEIQSEPIVQRYSDFIQCNLWPNPSLSQTFQFIIDAKPVIFQEGIQNQIKLLKNRSLSKKYLLGSLFQSKNHRNRKTVLGLQTTHSAPKLRELEKSLFNMPRQLKPDQEEYKIVIEQTDQSVKNGSEQSFMEIPEISVTQSQHQLTQFHRRSVSRKTEEGKLSIISQNQSKFSSQCEQFLMMSPQESRIKTERNTYTQKHTTPPSGEFKNYLDTEMDLISEQKVEEEKVNHQKNLNPNQQDDSEAQSLIMILSPSDAQYPPNESNPISAFDCKEPLNEINLNNKTNVYEMVVDPSVKFKSIQNSGAKQSVIHHKRNFNSVNYEEVRTNSRLREEQEAIKQKQQIDQDRKEKILQSVKSGKFVIKSKKSTQSGRMKYKQVNSTISDTNVSEYKSSMINQSIKDNITIISSINNDQINHNSQNNKQSRDNSMNESNVMCKHCKGTNWNQKYNMPCSNCVDTPLLSARKVEKSFKRKKNMDYPRQMSHPQSNQNNE
ncbi:UNKNOWN [Stylonychia lemnae]|uniref:Uncharacterized protein n=1 Tax=Stylonychia lemnae TaxID=5949 RepID=A0A078AYT1_STYLE|nr:UNKNOWN [Stylonychia lemnae]|eukprot:CDW85928.1 UNKNOWN [Stylonychia lemnae]